MPETAQKLKSDPLHRRSPGKLTITGLLFIPLLAACAVLPDTDKPFRSDPVELSEDVSMGDIFMGIRLLGSLELTGRPGPGIDINELSGIAWDPQLQVLHAVSDRGWLHQFQPSIEQQQLRGLTWLSSTHLKDRKGSALRTADSDAEGLILVNTPTGSELWVSFEGRPRVSRYTRQGRLLGEIPLAAELKDVDNYRSRNTALEALVRYPGLGLLSGPEQAMNSDTNGQIGIYSAAGLVAHYPLANSDSALTAMEVHPDAGLIMLEREYTSPLTPLITRLRHWHPEHPNKVSTIALMDNAKGWFIDNFEGLAHHQDRRYFMVSDNNGVGLQRSLLLYFEVLPK